MNNSSMNNSSMNNSSMNNSSMNNSPTPRASLLSIDPYVPGKSGAKSTEKVYKLSSNETPLGASPKAISAFANESKTLALYPEGSAATLREAIGSRYNVNPQQIICGAGSDDILTLIAHAYIGESDEAIYTTHGFLVYRIAILAAGGKPIIAEETNLTANVDNILSRVTNRTKVVFLANPNNPTGTYLPIAEIERLQKSLPPQVLLVLDSAYAQYVTQEDYRDGLDLASKTNNVIVTQTFSKIYGLAGLRLGWGYAAPEIIAALNRIRGPFNVSSPAMAAGVAAISDIEHEKKAVEHNTIWREWVSKEISGLGLEVTPSVANFILIHFPQTAGKTAEAADSFLSQRGLILRQVKAYSLPDALRLTIGSEEANRLVVSVLKEFMSSEK